MLITNPPKQRTFGHCVTQPDWPNLTLPYIANFFKNPVIVDNSHRYKSPRLKGEIAISIRSEREYPAGFEMIKEFGIGFAGGQSAEHHRDGLEKMGVRVVGVGEPKALDDTPFPRWDLVKPIPSYFFKGRYTGSLEMSRGCPHSCDFCAVTSYWKEFKQKSNERILEELKFLRQMGRTHIYLTDDNFGFNVRKHTELLEKIADLDLKLFTQIRADTIARNPEMIRLAKRAGFYGFLIGFDTYDPKVFTGEHKKSSVEINTEASQICRANDIAIYGCHIFGLPSQERPEDFERTFELGRQNSDLFVMSLFNPLPGTKSANKAPKRDEAWMQVYADFYERHQWSIEEFWATLTHRNPVVRKLKRGGYKKYLNYKLR